jgi:hypothetical protein
MKTTHLFFAIFLLVLFNAQAQSQTLPTDGLVGYFPFNGNANDESGNAHPGTVYGATPTTDRFGNPNSAYYFDGVDNYIVLPPNIITGKDSTFTITFWYKSELDSGMIMTDRSNVNLYPYFDEYIFHLENECSGGSKYSGPARASWSYLNYYSSKGFVFVAPFERVWSLQPNQWRMGYIQTKFSGYAANGYNKEQVFKGETYYPCGFKGLKSVYIGKDISTGAFMKPFNGLIDDIRIYNRSLSPDEINLLENNKKQTNN